MTTIPAGAAEVFGDALGVAERYANWLTGAGVERGLLGPREAPRVWERHVLNSAALSSLIPDGATVVDVGSGAGLPGVPLALARPDLSVTLLEPLLRRTTFLGDVVADLGLADRVRVVRGRAEEHDRAYDVVVSRAVARLGTLATWCAPLLCDGGVALALKGSSAAEEVAEADDVLRRLGVVAEVLSVRSSPSSEPATAVRLRQLG